MFVNNYSWSAGGPLNLARGWVYWPLLCHRCHQCCHPFGSRAHILSAALWRTLLQWSLSVGATRLHGPGVSHRDQSGPPAWAQGPLSIGQWLGGAGGGGGGVGAGDLDAPPPHTHTHTHLSSITHTQPLNGNAILSPPMACPLWNTSLIWKRHAYVFMWPPAPRPRANPNQ